MALTDPGTLPVWAVEPNGVHLSVSTDSVTARLEGDACLDSEALMRQVLLGAVRVAAAPGGRPGPPLGLVVDLTGLTFCDLRGLDVLTDTVAEGRSVGVSVTLLGASPTLERVRRLLDSDLPKASRQGPDAPSTTGPWREQQHVRPGPTTRRRFGTRILRLATRRA